MVPPATEAPLTARMGLGGHMRLRTILAAATATVLAFGGVALGSATAHAAPGDLYLPESGIVRTADAAEEAAAYNVWHFSPGRDSLDRQEPNGFVVPANGDALVLRGNGNDIAKTDPAARPDATTITDLAASLSIVATERNRIVYQIPVFYDYARTGTSWQFTTLFKNVDGADAWQTSRTIPLTGTTPEILGSTTGNSATYPLADIVAALDANGADARPIGAGFLVYLPAAEALVSSFTANGETTRFYDEPTIDRKAGTGASAFVHSNDINPDETTYEGWHEGVDPAHPDLGTFATLPGTGHVQGLQVTGKSQLIYGYDPAQRPQNALPQILADAANGFVVAGTPSPSLGFEVQVPLFFYQEGVSGQQFTTLRAAIPADGRADDSLLWAASRAIGSAPANTYLPLSDILDEMSSYEVLAHGFMVETGTVLVTSASFNGHVTAFATPAPSTGAPAAGPQPLANSGAVEGTTTFAAIAALALLVAGGTVLALRRLQG